MEDLFLIKQVVAGNQNAFRFLVIRYQRPLFRFLNSYSLSPQVIDELAQETFLRAYQNIATYDAEKGASFSSWIFVIAKNLAFNELEKHYRKNEITGGEETSSGYETALDTSAAADELLDQDFADGKLTQALKNLPLIFRTALTLSYFKELTLEEVATIEGCSVGTVKSRIFRGKNLLRLALSTRETLS